MTVAGVARTEPLLPSSTYVVTLNPEFSLAITDRAGNPFDRGQLWLDTSR